MEKIFVHFQREKILLTLSYFLVFLGMSGTGGYCRLPFNSVTQSSNIYFPLSLILIAVILRYLHKKYFSPHLT